MSAEVHVSPKTLAVRFNGVYSPTDRGHLAHELVRIDKVLRNNVKLKTLFSMSDKMVQEYKLRMEELCDQLDLPSEEKARTRSIKGFNGYLASVGFPSHKIKI